MNAIQQVRAALEKSDRNNAEIATEAGIHATTLSRFKKDRFKNSISADNLVKLAAVLGMEIVARPARKKSV